MKQTILDLSQENGTLSMIVQKRIITENEITYNAEVLKAKLCDYNDAYILIKGDITVTAAPEIQVAFKNCAPFTKYITKINGTTIDEAKHLHLVKSFYNLIECSSNFSGTTGSLQFHSNDEATDFNQVIANNNLNLLNIMLNYEETQLINLLQMQLLEF